MRLQGKRRLLVLVVEDEPLLMMNAVDMIATMGFEIVEARNADEAIAVLESRSDVHLVFTDIHMPGTMNGLNLAHFVRKRWPPVKIIATSGKARLAEDDLPSGGMFLSKPYTVRDVGNVFDRMAAQQS